MPTTEEIFYAAMEVPDEGARRALLDRLCRGDAGTRADVESLLDAWESAVDFLQSPLHALDPDSFADADAAGTRDRSGLSVGRYEVRRRIGSGGMGEVWLAHDRELNRDVAIKFLSPRHTANPAWLNRFRREARAVGALNHPGILTIHEIAESEGEHYLVTEYVDGKTLRELLAEGPLPVNRCVDLGIQIAAALSAAHAAKIVHRDLKPENIIVRSDGLAKVLDFGLAKQLGLDGSSRAHESTDYRHDTRQGSLLGTIRYMSPEQARGQSVDTRSDEFSLGGILFEMLTGVVPFAGDSDADTIAAVLNRATPSMKTLRPETPPELQRIVSRLLQKNPAERYQSTLDLLLDLRQVSSELRAESPDTGVRQPSGTPMGSSRPDQHATLIAETADETFPEVRYTISGDVNIAYQVFGAGAIDLVFVMGWVSHLDWFWEEPSFARFLRRLARFSRVILFDKRGTGLSDRVPVDQLPTLEQRMDDVRAVMDAVGSDRAVLCGVSEGGPMCSLFAATYPQKTLALVMIGGYARRLWDEDYPWGPTEAQRNLFLDEIRRTWGGPIGLEDRAPSRAADPAFRQWWATYLRMGASPGAALALTRMNAQIDIRAVLGSIQVPALVIHRAEDRCLRVEEGRFLAGRIPGARFVELPGSDHLPFVGNQDEILDEIEEFLTGVRHATHVDRVLATVLVLTIRGTLPEKSAADPADGSVRPQFDSHVERELKLFRGANVHRTGTSYLATFDGPARAIRAARAVRDTSRRLGMPIRIGLHTGECDISPQGVRGAAVRAAEQIAVDAAPGEILVSGTVCDLVAGSGIEFEEHGVIEFPAHPGLRRLCRVIG